MALGVKNAPLIAGLGRIWQSGSMLFFLDFDLKQIIISPISMDILSDRLQEDRYQPS
jgi:hypothetical protein